MSLGLSLENRTPRGKNLKAKDTGFNLYSNIKALGYEPDNFLEFDFFSQTPKLSQLEFLFEVSSSDFLLEMRDLPPVKMDCDVLGFVSSSKPRTL